MEALFATILSFLLIYKYFALFAVSFLASFLLPLPSSSLLAASGAFASQGYFSLNYVLVVALLGNVCGDSVGYFLARLYGEETLRKVGFTRILDSRRYIQLRTYMEHFSYPVVYFSRFITSVGPAVNIISGVTRLPYKKYFPVEIAGEISYVLLYGMMGYYLGSAWENNIGFFIEVAGALLFIGVCIGVGQHYTKRYIRRRNAIN
jgi:membrane protein DedA with SNARE-associated domain